MRFLIAITTVLAALAAAEVLDRIAVTLGKQVIPESQVVQYLRVTAFLDQKAVDLSGAAKREAAERLVDQVLLLQEAADTHAPLPSSEEAGRLLEEVKLRYPTPQAYRETLKHFHVTEKEVADHLLAGLRSLVFTEQRFAPEVQISEEDLRAYFDKLLDERPSTGANGAPSFEASREQLEKLLRYQRTTEAADRWLEDARVRARVQYKEKAFQ